MGFGKRARPQKAGKLGGVNQVKRVWNRSCSGLGMADGILNKSRDEQRSSVKKLTGWVEDFFVLGGLALICMTGIALFATQTSVMLPTDEAVEIEVAELPEPAEPEEPDVVVEALPEIEVVQTPLAGERPVPADLMNDTSPAFIALFGDGPNPARWHRSDHPGSVPFWKNDTGAENADASVDGLKLSITDRTKGPGNHDWLTGEISTKSTFGYGRYEVVMKPAKGAGLVSAFFTYTGPYFGKPHDEIDIEFLGKDTRRVELNMFKNGVPSASETVRLPFDASEDFHHYAIEWRPDRVAWFVDGELIHETEPGSDGIPVTPGKITMNLWTGDLYGWHGRPNFESGATAEYACVSYRPFGQPARSCIDFYPPVTPERSDLLLAAN